MGTSKIAWTDKTWNPISGCSPVSSGCKNCYAKRMAKRLAGRAGYPPAPDEFTVTLQDSRLDQPLHWRKPCRVFVCSMGDLFHPEVPTAYLNAVFQTMKDAPQHTYQVLTKRSVRMHDYLTGEYGPKGWPFPHVWLGVTAENQTAANQRVWWLAQTPAWVRWVSVEPMLGLVCLQVEWGQGLGDLALESGKIDWVIAGAESGPGHRRMNEDWVRCLKNQCVKHGVAFFYKQRWNAIIGKMQHLPFLDNQIWDQYPDDRIACRCNRTLGCMVKGCVHHGLHYFDTSLHCQQPIRCEWHRVKQGRQYEKVQCVPATSRALKQFAARERIATAAREGS